MSSRRKEKGVQQTLESTKATSGIASASRKGSKSNKHAPEERTDPPPRRGMKQAGEQFKRKRTAELDKNENIWDSLVPHGNDGAPRSGSDTFDQEGQQMASEPGQNNKQPCDDQWTSDAYRSFIKAVYNQGMKHASPSVIRQSMTMRSPTITSERIKSHLQKYRLHSKKNKGEFVTEYDTWMAKVTHAVGASDLAMGSTPLPTPRYALQLSGMGLPSAGALAAYLTYSVVAEERGRDQEQRPSGDPGVARLPSTVPQDAEQQEILARLASDPTFVFPALTDEEKHSSIGRMLMHVMALCMELNDQILQQRHGAQSSERPDATASLQRGYEDRQQQQQATTIASSTPSGGIEDRSLSSSSRSIRVASSAAADDAIDHNVAQKKPRFDDYALPSAPTDRSYPPYRPLARSLPVREANQSLSETDVELTVSSRSDHQSSSRQPASATSSTTAQRSTASYRTQWYPLPELRRYPSSYSYQQDADLRSNDSFPSSLDEAQRLYYPLGDRQNSSASLEDDLVYLSSRVRSPDVDEDQEGTGRSGS
jgi:SHAQKYF class myb-like DNA-binding protein